ncbi:BTB/POZ domain-containing protein [Glycine soja]
MGDRVETLARLAQWKIDNFGPCSYKKSDPFKLGIWNWIIHPFFDSFFESPQLHISPVQEKLLRTHDDFVWPVDTTFVGRLIIDVEFLDLKICPPNGGETSSVWPSDGNSQSIAFQNSTLRCLSRMLDEAIHADLTIMTADGSTLRAHKAVLSASSPVFQSMYHLNLKEK